MNGKLILRHIEVNLHLVVVEEYPLMAEVMTISPEKCECNRILQQQGLATKKKEIDHAVVHEIILAGGLNKDNVREGIRRFAPDVVDVSSAVEGCDGKDKNKIKAFADAVREA